MSVMGGREIPGLDEDHEGPALPVILRAIEQAGALGFEAFVELALYDAETGYYGSGRAVVGEAGGDFFTNVSIGRVYGRLMARQCFEVWEVMGFPQGFVLAEQGAHDGTLMGWVLEEFGELAGDRRGWSAVIVEGNPVWRARQQERLQCWGERCRWADAPEEVRERAGVFFCNELLDALPFAVMVWDGRGWRERCVVKEGKKLGWGVREPDERLQEAIAGWPVPRVCPFVAEVRPMLRDWVRGVAGMFERGLVVVCDYGFPSTRDFFEEWRREGTLRCYFRHRMDGEPLSYPGLKDITAHVDFQALTGYAVAAGLEVLGLCDQHHFLTGAAEGWLRSLEGRGLSEKERREVNAFRRLWHPESMGRQFWFWVAGRGLPVGWSPGGLRYGNRMGPGGRVCC